MTDVDTQNNEIIEDKGESEENSLITNESSLAIPENNLIVVQDIRDCPYKEAVIYNINPIEHKGLVLCDGMYEWLQAEIPPIITMDFCGWLFPIEEDKNFMCAVTIKGDFKIMPSPWGKKFKYKKAAKLLDIWMKKGYIREISKEDPYIEYEMYNHLKLDYYGAQMIPLPVFDYKLMDKDLAEDIFSELALIEMKGDFSNLPAIGV